MISFKKDDDFIELPKKLNVAPSRIEETIPNEDSHFYRYFVSGAEEEKPAKLKFEPPVIEEIVPEPESSLQQQAPVEPQPPLLPLPIERFFSMLKKPDLNTASFLEVKLWALLHTHYRSGIDFKDLLTIKNQDLDLEKETFTIHLANSQNLSFTLHSDLIPILKIYIDRRKGQPEDFLFCNEQGKELTPITCHFQIQKLLASHQLTDYSSNDLIKFYQELF